MKFGEKLYNFFADFNSEEESLFEDLIIIEAMEYLIIYMSDKNAKIIRKCIEEIRNEILNKQVWREILKGEVKCLMKNLGKI